MSNNRRTFLQQIGVLGTAGLVAANNTADAKSAENVNTSGELGNQSKEIDRKSTRLNSSHRL